MHEHFIGKIFRAYIIPNRNKLLLRVVLGSIKVDDGVQGLGLQRGETSGKPGASARPNGGPFEETIGQHRAQPALQQKRIAA